MKKLLYLFGILLFLTACGNTTFSVTMQEAGTPADTVTLTVTLPPPPGETPAFAINGILYQVVSSPTAADPVYVLDTREEDGMQSVTLHMQTDSAAWTELHMLTEEGAERIYTATDADAFRPLLNRAGQN